MSDDRRDLRHPQIRKKERLLSVLIHREARDGEHDDDLEHVKRDANGPTDAEEPAESSHGIQSLHLRFKRLHREEPTDLNELRQCRHHSDHDQQRNEDVGRARRESPQSDPQRFSVQA